jgi:hypothetical protein
MGGCTVYDENIEAKDSSYRQTIEEFRQYN